MIEQLITECLLGALTGYVTNDIALKQLFRDGGIVEKEKDEFIEALIDLIQNEVFTEAQIKKILEKPEVKVAIDRLVKRFFDESLPNAFNGVTLEDFPKHKEASLALVCYLNDQEGQHDSLINIEGIYKNLLSLVETGALNEAIETLLEHFSNESLKEAIGELRYERYIKARLKLAFAGSEEALTQRVEAFYERLTQSEVRLSDYLSLSPEEMTEVFLLNVRQVLSEEKLSKVIDYLEAPNTNGGEQIFFFSDAFLDKFMAQLIDLFLGHFSKKEDVLANLALASVKEATRDLGEGVQKALVGYLEEFFSPSWLRRESLGFIRENKLKEQFITRLPKWKEKILDYLYSENLKKRVNDYLLEIWDLPLKQVFARYPKNSAILVNIKDSLGFLLESITDFSKERGLFEKLENMPLGLWLLTPKVRSEIKEKLSAFIAQLSNGSLDETVYRLEKEFGWKKRLNEQLVAVLAQQDLGKIYQIANSSSEKETWLSYSSQKVSDLLEQNLSQMIAKATKSYLMNLEQKEIRQIVNALLGKEMRPLSFLGGAIGFMTGFGLGLFTTETEGQGVVLSDIGLRSLTYGAIGYGTNVLAVHSLFRPYQKRLGWQGLLPKNKHRFARKMGYMTEHYVADEKVWKGYLESFASRFDDKLDNGFSYLSGVGLLEGRETIKLTGLWLNRPLKSFFTTDEGEVSNLLDDAIKLILKDEHFKAGFERLVKTRIMPHLAENFYQYSDKTSTYLWDTFKDKGINQLDKELLIYLDRAIDKGFDYLESLGQEEVMSRLDAIFMKLKLPQAEAFYESFVRLMMSKYESLLPLFQKNEKFFAKLLIEKVKKNLGFRAGLAYRMMSGDRYVLRAVRLFLEEKLPSFLENEKDAISASLLAFFKQAFMGKSLYDLGLSTENPHLRAFVFKLFEASEKEKIKLSLMIKVKDRLIVPLRTFAKREGIFTKSLGHYLNLSRLGEEGEKVLLPKIERFFLLLQEEALSYVLTSHLKELFPDWAKNVALEIGNWEVASMLNVDRLSHIEAVLNGKGVLPDNRFKLAIETYMYDMSQCLLPEVSKLLVSETKPLLQAFDFSTVAMYAIDKKDAKALEQMIRQIANPYFRRVERMGLLGAVVALPSSVLSRLFL